MQLSTLESANSETFQRCEVARAVSERLATHASPQTLSQQKDAESRAEESQQHGLQARSPRRSSGAVPPWLPSPALTVLCSENPPEPSQEQLPCCFWAERAQERSPPKASAPCFLPRITHLQWRCCLFLSCFCPPRQKPALLPGIDLMLCEPGGQFASLCPFCPSSGTLSNPTFVPKPGGPEEAS